MQQECNEDSLVLMMQKPTWCFAYWSLAGQTQDKLLLNSGRLRVFHGIGDWQDYFIKDLDKKDGKLYIPVPSNSEIYAAFGISDGLAFRELMRSNSVRTPAEIPLEELAELSSPSSSSLISPEQQDF